MAAGRCVMWALGGLFAILALSLVVNILVDVDWKDALKWKATFRPIWLGVFVIVVIGPLSEEVLFRGLIPKELAFDPFHRGFFGFPARRVCRRSAVYSKANATPSGGQKSRAFGGLVLPTGCVAALERCPASLGAPRLPG